MLPINKILQKVLLGSVMGILAVGTAQGQDTRPTWRFGASGAANLNFYDGTTQRLNNSLIVPAAFHKGFGVRPYGSLLVEYSPAKVLGAMLNLAYDDRGGKFDGVMAPCDCPATLKTTLSYFSIEPALRVNAANFYFFAGPRVAFNLQNDFAYTQLKQPNTDAELSDMRKTILTGQVGVGYDYQFSSPNSNTKFIISPFVSYHPYFGQDPRDIESLTITTLRTGIALKFGKVAKVETAVPEVTFVVRAPKTVPVKRQVSETLPLRNSVFFDEGSATVPNRYVQLTKQQATDFKEVQLQNEQTETRQGRSARQLNVYHNLLNILGDRMRANPSARISLSGASAKGAEDGKAMAESIKSYLVTVFNIDGSRIATEGRTKPLIPSEQPGGTKELVLLRAGDQRVDIQSASPELLMEVGGGLMKPVQIISTQVDPLDSHVVLNVGSEKDPIKSWTIEAADEQGVMQHYGPFTSDQGSIPGNSILGNRPEGDYKITMRGETKNGVAVTKESTVHLVSQNEVVDKGYRYSILFDFDKEKSIASYDKFLTDIVSPLISEGSTVIVHGHTDIIGDEAHNNTLSRNRAEQTQKIIQAALTKAGKTNVKFDTFGFGEDPSQTPFENNLPEERFYNRTVIIDIIPAK
jgi:outer membrane protein OmpA-like peptidoglycan-associated protein